MMSCENEGESFPARKYHRERSMNFARAIFAQQNEFIFCLSFGASTLQHARNQANRKVSHASTQNPVQNAEVFSFSVFDLIPR